jgi:hypothetical protein
MHDLVGFVVGVLVVFSVVVSLIFGANLDLGMDATIK